MADNLTTQAAEPQRLNPSQNQTGAPPGEKKAKIAVPKKPRDILLGVGFNAAGKQIIVYSITERAKARTKVVISGFHLNIFDRIILGVGNHWFAPVNLHKAYGDSEQVSFLMPNFNKLLGDSGEIRVQLVSFLNPKASGIIKPYLIYTTKTQEEEAKGKEDEKKQKGAGAGKEEGPGTGFAGMAVAGVGGVISGIIKPIAGSAAKEDKKFEPKELSFTGPSSPIDLDRQGAVDEESDLFEDYNEQLKAEEVEELEGMYQTEETAAASSNLEVSTGTQTISQGSTITGSESIQQSGGTAQASGAAGGYSTSGSTTQTAFGGQTIGTSGTVASQTQGKISETVSSTITGQQQTGASAKLSQQQTTTVSAGAPGQQAAGVSGKVSAQQQAGVSGSATAKQETRSSGSQATEANVQGTQKTEAETQEKISTQGTAQSQASLEENVQAQGKQTIGSQAKAEGVLDEKASVQQQASQTISTREQYSTTGSSAGMGTMPQPQVSQTPISPQTTAGSTLQPQPKAEAPEQEGKKAEEKPKVQEPAELGTKPAEIPQAQEKKPDESETKPSEAPAKPESKPEEEEIKIPEEFKKEIEALREGSLELKQKVGMVAPEKEEKKQPEQGEKGEGENLPEKPGLKKPLQYPAEGKEPGALGPTPRDNLKEPSLREKDRVPSGRPGGIDGAKAPLQGKPKDQEELDKETSPQTPPEESGQEPKTEEGEESEGQEPPEEQAEGQPNEEEERLPIQQWLASKTLLEADKFKADEAAANKLLNSALNKAALWVWGAIVPTLGLSILLGALAGDIIWAFKDKALRMMVKKSPIVNKFSGSNFKVKLNWSVKGQIIAMNAIALAFIALVIVFVMAVFWGICNFYITYPIRQTSGMQEVCQYLDKSKIGGALNSLKSSGTFQASYATPGALVSTAQWTSQINLYAQKYNIDACILRVVVQKESGGTANAIGCDCAANGSPQLCKDSSKTYYSGYQFNWDQCSYGIGLTQWTIYPKGGSGYKAWQDSSTPSRNVESDWYGVQSFLDPNTSLDLTAHVFSDNLAKANGDVSSAFAAYVGASSIQSQLVSDRMSLYNLCKGGGSASGGNN